MVNARSATAAALAILTFSACGRGATPSTQGAAGTKSAFLRIVDGSPDIETANPTPGAPACNFQTTQPSFGGLVSVQVNGVQQLASFPYGTVSSYLRVTSGTVRVAVVYPASLATSCPSYSFSVSLAPSSYHTVVVAGSYQKGTLTDYDFVDAPAAGAQIYGTAPSAAPIGAGTFTPGSSNYTQAAVVAVGATASLPVSASAPGTGYYVGNGATPVAILEPSNVDSFDVNNVVPFNGYQTLSIFIIDPPLGAAQPHLTGGFQ